MASIDPHTFVCQRGRDCATAGLRNLMSHHGQPLSEAMVFGLGGGWWFWYCHLPMAPFPVLIGQNLSVEQDFCARLSIPCQWREPADAAELQASLEEVRCGRPSIMKADPYYLDYCWDGLPMDQRHHFGEHMVLAVAVTGPTVWISDIWSDALQQIPLERFQQARSTDEGPPYLRPRGRWLDIRMPPVPVDWRTRIVDATRDMVARMQESRGDFGLEGLRSAGPRLIAWLERQTTDPAVVSEALGLIALRLDGGAGASGFRAFLADFLEEASELTGAAALTYASRETRRSVVPLWAEAIDAMRSLAERADDSRTRDRLGAILNDIAVREQTLCQILSSL